MKNLCWFAASCCLSVFVGCGGGLGTVPASGKVLVDGEPMEDVVVLFTPDAADGMPASGRTNANGEFELTTEINGDGALPGSYKVSVSKYEEVGGVELPEDEIDPNDEAAMDAIYNALDKAGTDVETKALIAKRFNNASTSGLEASVSEEGPNEFTFEVTSR